MISLAASLLILTHTAAAFISVKLSSECEIGNKINVTGDAGQVGMLPAWPVTSVSEFSDQSIET